MNLLAQLGLARGAMPSVVHCVSPKAGNRPGEARLRKAMGDQWLTTPEIMALTGAMTLQRRNTVDAIMRRYEKQGIIIRKRGYKIGNNGFKMIEWRFK